MVVLVVESWSNVCGLSCRDLGVKVGEGVQEGPRQGSAGVFGPTPRCYLSARSQRLRLPQRAKIDLSSFCLAAGCMYVGNHCRSKKNKKEGKNKAKEK